jgi:hypothetical protein
MTPHLSARDRPPGSDIGHDHGLAALRAVMVVVVLGLVAGIVIVYAALTVRVSDLEEYVEGRGQARDAENARQDQRIDDAVCDVLDRLPTGSSLDPVRAQYGCGPGLPAAP